MYKVKGRHVSQLFALNCHPMHSVVNETHCIYILRIYLFCVGVKEMCTQIGNILMANNKRFCKNYLNPIVLRPHIIDGK